MTFTCTVDDNSIATLTTENNITFTLKGLKVGSTKATVKASDGTKQDFSSLFVRTIVGCKLYYETISCRNHRTWTVPSIYLFPVHSLRRKQSNKSCSLNIQ